MEGSRAGGENRVPDAERYYRRALDQEERLVAEFPTEADYRDALVSSCTALGTLQMGYMDELEEGAKSFRRAVELSEQLVAEFPTNPSYRKRLADLHLRLGYVLSVTARPHEAEQAFREGLEAAEQLALQFPSIPDYRHQLGSQLLQLGQLLAKTGRPEEAEPLYRRAVGVYEKLAVEVPSMDHYWHSFVMACQGLARLLSQAEQPHEAEVVVRRVLALAEKLALDLPTEGIVQRRLMDGNAALGYFLQENTNRIAEAAQAYRQALVLLDQHTEAGPAGRAGVHASVGNPSFCYANLGELLWQLGRHEEGRQVYGKLFALWEKTGTNLGQLWILATCPYPELRDPARAVELARKELEKNPKRGSAWTSLGAAYFHAGDWKAAVEALEKAEAHGDSGNNFFFLAMAHWQLGVRDQAHRWYRRGVEEMRKFAYIDPSPKRWRVEAEELLGIKAK